MLNGSKHYSCDLSQVLSCLVYLTLLHHVLNKITIQNDWKISLSVKVHNSVDETTTETTTETTDAAMATDGIHGTVKLSAQTAVI